jgi:uncharacterized membrane-anchored protein
MLARLGNVLYWLGCGLAIVVTAVGAVIAHDTGLGFFVAALVIAALIWLVGRACRYVLSGN